jgi:hypothetical protein
MKKDPRLYIEAAVSGSENACRQALEVGTRCGSFGRLQRTKTRKPYTNSLRITSAVQDSPDSGHQAFLIVIDGVGEALGQQAMVPKPLGMNSRVKVKRFDVGKQRLLEIISQSCLLPFVKIESVGEIVPRRGQNEDSHFTLLRSCVFAASQSMKDSLPCSTRVALSRRTSPCHSGDSICSSLRVKSLQRLSIIRSFSAMVIFSNGNVISIFFSITLNRLNLAFPGDIVNSGWAILAIVNTVTDKEGQ